jgi:lipoprotein-anchoring transpeptidase ErfK/SrfK
MREVGLALAAALVAAAYGASTQSVAAQVVYNAPMDSGWSGRVVGPPRGGAPSAVVVAPGYGSYAPVAYAPSVVPNYGPLPTPVYGAAPLSAGPPPTAVYGRMEPPVYAPAPQPYLTAPQAYAPARTPIAYAPMAQEPEGDLRPHHGVNPKFRRAEIAYDGPHAPGTVIVDTPRRYLYLVEEGGRALRYGIGVGRPGFEWSGVKHVTRKSEWPEWRPPPEMLKRRPELPTFMAGGPKNPLGARALYLGSSLYRIHGTNEPHSIGQNVSSGCIRMMNEDVIDLYDRVPVGAKVVVI